MVSPVYDETFDIGKELPRETRSRFEYNIAQHYTWFDVAILSLEIAPECVLIARGPSSTNGGAPCFAYVQQLDGTPQEIRIQDAPQLPVRVVVLQRSPLDFEIGSHGEATRFHLCGLQQRPFVARVN
jgi:hypothetical protein